MYAGGQLSRSSKPTWLFFAIVSLVNGLVLLRTHLGLSALQQSAFLKGLVVDLALTIPASYYLLTVRGRHQGWAGLLIVTALCWVRALYLLPAPRFAIAILSSVLEVLIFVWVVVAVRRQSALSDATLDPVLKIRNTLSLATSEMVATVLSYELATFYYATAVWKCRPHVPNDAESFTLHHRSGAAILYRLASIASLLEAFVAHLIIERWSASAAWVSTAISLYGTLWLFAVSRSFALRPTLVQRGRITLRMGFLRQLQFNPSDVLEIETSPKASLGRPHTKTVWFGGRTEGGILITFKQPKAVHLLFGFTRKVTAAVIAPDDAPAFVCAIRKSLTTAEGAS